MTTDDILKRIAGKIKPQWWAAFFACVVIGLLTYMYFMTNNFLTYDSMWNLYSDQDMITSGRQFLTYACGVSSFYNLPWVNGVLAILYLALTSVVVVEGLGIQSKTGAVLTAGLLVTFPAVSSTFCYMYTVDGYMLAVLLSALAFLITDRKKYGFVGGIILLGVSMGIYQAYLSFTIMLCITRLLTDLLEEDKLKPVWSKIWRYVVMGIGSYVFYVISLKIMLKVKDVEISGYQGTDRIGTFALAEIPAGLLEAYKSFGRFVLSANVLTTTTGMKVAVIIIAILAIITYLVYYIIKKRYSGIVRTILIFVLLLVTPIGATIVSVLSPNTFFHLLMRLAWVLFFIYAVLLNEKLACADIIKFKKIKRGVVWVSFLCTAILIFEFSVMANVVAFNMNERYEKTYAICIRMIDRIEQTEGYSPDTKVALLGGVLDASYYPDTDITRDDLIGYFGVAGTMCISDTEKFAEFSKHYLNVTIETISLAEEIELTETEEFKEMPKFPAEGSVRYIDDILVIKWNG